MAGVLAVATCQFPVSSNVVRNGGYVIRQMRVARERGALVAHFPEACLSGYAGSDCESYEGFDWDVLERVTRRVLDLACELGLWVVVGSAHRLTGGHKPHNSVYVVDHTGALVERYDKRFCAGDASGRSGDLAHFTPGDHFSVFSIGGIRCGVLICYDYRYPELYREYKRRGVQLMFHSFHAAHATPDRFAAMRATLGAGVEHLNSGATFTYPGITMPATMTAAAAANHMWISCPNSSARESCWGAFFVRADGVTTGRLPRNRAGVLISMVDTDAELYDSTVTWRERALSGVLHSGELVEDPRSEERTQL
jgi:predicted amidohydrolase